MTPLQFEGLVNARDLGGLPAGPGRRTRSRRLFRSETPELMTPADLRLAVEELGVGLVVDLRGPRGGGSGPLGEAGRGWVVDFFAEAGGYDAQQDLTPDGFLPGQLAHGAPSVGRIMARLVATDGATWIHCHTGKDRTGYVIATILAAVGVPDEAIIADYARSSAVYEQMIANLTAAGRAVPDTAPLYARHAPSEVGITAMLAQRRERWGTGERYLIEFGVPPELIEQARAQLTEPA